MRFRPLFGVVLMGWVAVPVCEAQSTWWVDIHAPVGGHGSQEAPFERIQAALDVASTGDTVFVLPGTYNERIRFRRKSLRVEGLSGASVTRIRAPEPGSVVTIDGDGAALIGFSVEGGTGFPATWFSIGGGILIDDAVEVLVELCEVRDNSAGVGGGIYMATGTGVVRGCLVENNLALFDAPYCSTGSGGGISGPAGLRVDNCVIRSNMAGQNGGGVNGASVFGSFVTGNVAAAGAGMFGGSAESTSFIGNHASSCDGSYSSGGGVESSTLTRCVVQSNAAWDDGGGAARSTLIECRIAYNETLAAEWLWTRGAGAFDCALVDCWIEGNVARGALYGLNPSEGGGMYRGSALRCVLFENRADTGAGAAWATLDRCTVLSNLGGGVESSQVANSIIAPNEGPSVGGEWSNVRYSCIAGGFPGLGNIDLDPLMWDPLLGDVRLMPQSPCIDTGDPASFDPDGSRVDMGARSYSPSDCLPPIRYCSGGTSSNSQCVPTIQLSGTPSVSAASGCDLFANEVPALRMGLIVFSLSGENGLPWGGTSWNCLRAPRVRTGAHSSGGVAGTCGGVLSVDFNTWLSAHGSPLALGTIVWAQAWYRDPPAELGSNFSDALRFSVCP